MYDRAIWAAEGGVKCADVLTCVTGRGYGCTLKVHRAFPMKTRWHRGYFVVFVLGRYSVKGVFAFLAKGEKHSAVNQTMAAFKTLRTKKQQHKEILKNET